MDPEKIRNFTSVFPAISYIGSMRELAENSDAIARHRRTAARRLLKSELFWFFMATFMMTVGLIGRFGIDWILWLAAGVVLAITAYGYLPGVQEKKRVAWEVGRGALLEKWSVIVGKLGKSSRERYNRLHLRVSRLGDLHPTPNKGSLLRPGEYLLWLYLKLLLARDLLEEGIVSSSEGSIIEQRNQILSDLEHSELSAVSRQSKEETVIILDQRLDTARNRAGRIQEIESDLTRIEQKMALMCDRAAQHNTMGDSGRRINFSDEVQTGSSLASLAGSHIEEMDTLVTEQVCA